VNPVGIIVVFGVAIGLLVCITRALSALKYGDPYAEDEDEDEEGDDDFLDEGPTRRIPYVSLDDTARMWREAQDA